SGLRGAGGSAVVGVGVFLGVAALWYTLLPAYTAFTVAVMALTAAVARSRHRAALPARGRRAAVVPDAALHASRSLVHGRHDLAGGAGQDVDAGRRPGHRRPDRLCVVAAVDADHV